MEVTQIANIVNPITAEAIGESAVLNEDLSNVVELGHSVFDNVRMDNFTRQLVDSIGRFQFVNRTYTGTTLALYKDSYEYGACREKITELSLPEATTNEDWQFVNGASYDVNVFTGSDVAAKFYNKAVTYEIDKSIADIQVRSAFNSPEQLNAFISMLYNGVDRSLAVKNEELAKRTLNMLIAQTIAAEFPSVDDNDYSDQTGVKAVNLLYTYNQKFTKSLTAANCLYDLDFLRWASMIIRRYQVRMTNMSTLFNVGGLPRFTPRDLQRTVLHGDFVTSCGMYLESDTFHNELVSLGSNFVEVPYFQGSGSAFDLTSTGKIDVTIPVGNTTKNIVLTGVLGVIFDFEAAGITNYQPRVDSNYNAKANFTNLYYKQKASYFVDTNENAVVFFVA